MADEETTEETEETPEETPEVETPSDDEPPAWFKKHLEREEAAKKATPKTVAKPTKKAAPAKSATRTAAAPATGDAPSTPASTDSDGPPVRKRAGVSKSWFGNRAAE